jgi:hypothetical protein
MKVLFIPSELRIKRLGDSTSGPLVRNDGRSALYLPSHKSLTVPHGILDTQPGGRDESRVVPGPKDLPL